MESTSVLLIDRLTHEVTLKTGSNIVPQDLAPTTIYGIVGIIRLVAGMLLQFTFLPASVLMKQD